MVTPFAPISYPGTVSAADSPKTDSPSVRRSVSQAERIIQEERLTGADAMRVRGLLERAKSSDASGNASDAEHIARQALRTAQQAGGGTTLEASPSGAESGGRGEGGTRVQANSDGDTYEPMERETTNYRDSSSDSGVSFQSSQPLTAAQAPLAIAEHETSHLRRRSREATLNGQKVMQSVRYIHRIDPETGEIQVVGGRARTIVLPKKD